MTASTLAGLILVNLVWSAHPLMGKLLLEDFSPGYAAWLRYGSAFVAYLLVVLVSRLFPGGRRWLPEPFIRPRGHQEWALVFALGFMTFCFAPLLQLTGLAASRATENALIVAMEPLITVGFAWVFLRERLRWGTVVAFGLALAGFGLLTGGLNPHLSGNLLMLLALTGEACYSVLGRKLMARHSPIGIFGSSIAAGVFCLSICSVALVFLHIGPTASGALTTKSFLALLWLGPLGTAFAYLYWMVVVARVSVARMALTLFVQPVFGSLLGYFFLGERLSWMQGIGGLLILGAVFSQSWFVPTPRSEAIAAPLRD